MDGTLRLVRRLILSLYFKLSWWLLFERRLLAGSPFEWIRSLYENSGLISDEVHLRLHLSSAAGPSTLALIDGECMPLLVELEIRFSYVDRHQTRRHDIPLVLHFVDVFLETDPVHG